jgi:hypothetical protein
VHRFQVTPGWSANRTLRLVPSQSASVLLKRSPTVQLDHFGSFEISGKHAHGHDLFLGLDFCCDLWIGIYLLRRERSKFLLVFVEAPTDYSSQNNNAHPQKESPTGPNQLRMFRCFRMWREKGYQGRKRQCVVKKPNDQLSVFSSIYAPEYINYANDQGRYRYPSQSVALLICPLYRQSFRHQYHISISEKIHSTHCLRQASYIFGVGLFEIQHEVVVARHRWKVAQHSGGQL